MEFVFRRHRRRQHRNSLFQQVTGFIRRCEAANTARRRLVIVNAPRFLGKSLADVLGFSRHADQSLMQLRHGWGKHGGGRLFRDHVHRRPALDMRRRGQLAYVRSLALRTMHLMMPGLVAERLAGREPAFETVSLITKKIEDYHT